MADCITPLPPGTAGLLRLHEYRGCRRNLIHAFVADLQAAGIPALSRARHTQAVWAADAHTYGTLHLVLYTAPSAWDPAAPVLPRMCCNLGYPSPSARALARLGLPSPARPAPWDLELTATVSDLPVLAPWLAALALARREPWGPLEGPPVALEGPSPSAAHLRATASLYLWTRPAGRAYALWERGARRPRPAGTSASACSAP